MKKLTLSVIAVITALSMVSCKKDRTCTCVSSTNGGPSSTTTTVVKKATKNAALGGDCASTTDSYTSGGTSYVQTTTCTLK
ncbi:MAG: hypothetical protein ACXVPN_13200 [Bacteroidia bacterium]